MTDLKWKIKDILGFEVYDNKSNKLGLLSDVMTTGSNDIWVIKSQEEELLIPALKSIVTEVNILRKKIFVTLPDGYESMYGSKIKIDDILEYAGYIVYED